MLATLSRSCAGLEKCGMQGGRVGRLPGVAPGKARQIEARKRRARYRSNVIRLGDLHRVDGAR